MANAPFRHYLPLLFIYYLLLYTPFTKLQLPVPCRAQRVFNACFRLPAQLGIGQSGVGPYLLDVAGTTGSNLIVQLHTGRSLESVNQLQYGKSATCTYVEYFHFSFLLLVQDAVDGHYVSLGQVYHVDEVADAGTVRRAVIIAKHAMAVWVR